jgi:exoribonuclease R
VEGHVGFGVAKYGLFVTLLSMPVEGMVPLRLLTDDYYLVMEDDYTVVGKNTEGASGSATGYQ